MLEGSAYYNEIEPYAAEWLHNLALAGEITPGEVDSRDIRDVSGDDLAGYDQCHFFAGIGIWARALADAKWPADQNVWSGSCPCQPFSAAGKGKGFADERHLWPSWHWLIEQCRPDVIVGEQVSSPDGRTWLDLVFTDLEGSGYTCGAVIAPAAGIGAPHGRHRTYWMAYANGRQRHGLTDGQGRQRNGSAAGRIESDSEPVSGRQTGGMGDAECNGSPSKFKLESKKNEGWLLESERSGDTSGSLSSAECDGPVGDGATLDMGNAEGGGCERRQGSGENIRELGGASDAGGPWTDFEWLWHSDGKFRPIESGTFPLASKHPQRVGKLRAYGNSCVLSQATYFVKAVMKELGI